MLKWLREHRAYSRHQKWLSAHFGVLHCDDGQRVLTEIVTRLAHLDPEAAEFRDRAATEIQALTKPCDIYGQVVTCDISYRARAPRVPAKLVSVETVHKHALYCRDQREIYQSDVEKVAQRYPDLAKAMGWDGKSRRKL